MKNRISIKDWLALVFAIAGVVLLVASLVLHSVPGETDNAADRVERVVERRMEMLDNYMDHPSDNIPSDMVIYRYEQDTLYSWSNRFPIYNDDITPRFMFRAIVNPGMNFYSPLGEIRDSISFCNFGEKWYLVKYREEGFYKTIGGLEVMNTMDNNSFNGVNKKFHLGENYSIKPLSVSEGSVVSLKGVPVFKVHYDTLEGNVAADAGLVWIAFALMIASCVIFVESKRTIRRFGIAVSLIVLVSLAMYLWSIRAAADLKIFSPVLYAGGSVLHSLGSVIIINLAILVLAACLFLVRKDVYASIVTRRSMTFATVADLLMIAGILVYTHFAVRSIVLNSNICLELYRLNDLSQWTAVVYLSFLSMLVSVPMLIQMLQPAQMRFFGRHLDVFSSKWRVLFSVCTAVYFVIVTSLLGFSKEQSKVEVWANRLSVERDIMLEMQLRQFEDRFSGDWVISSLSVLENADNTIRNLISENYLPWLSQNYNLSVYVVNEDTHPRRAAMINGRIQGGEPISDESNFLYYELPGGQTRYDGVFLYFNDRYGLSRVIVEIQPKGGNQTVGYMSLLGTSMPGHFNLPSGYTYARYRGRAMLTYKGNYPYPTSMADDTYEAVFERNERHLINDGYNHFINRIEDNEVVIISRKQIGLFNFFIAIVFLALISYILLSFTLLSHKSIVTGSDRSYYKTRITWVLMVALIVTLVAMALVSIFFVYRRNEANLNTIMSDKITSIQTMVQDEVMNLRGPDPLRSPRLMTLLETVHDNTGSDITLYSIDGRLQVSTYAEIFQRQIIGSRIDRNAYENIVTRGKRYFINKETLGDIRYYCMYAPVQGPSGRISAILCSPYTGIDTEDFETDAMRHLLSIVTLFILLLLGARFLISRVLERMFKPLSEMGRKMNRADVQSLEYIRYDRQDEITKLVEAYNRMVTDLSESTRKLTQAERDKAWSGMARQVAHEIKNPLTPMKLQLQRIIRLKQRGDSEWQSKFDDVAKVLLDHIDILTDTANEFSTFAKLYTEEHTRINLDKVLQEEISMFDNKGNVEFGYFGLSDACVLAPKPQLTRVFVNLINNAVQALEGREDAKIYVSLRNSNTDGYYDIVVEDNGPGVAEDNIQKLFTPNFTTKNGGSGLGLAISRSILERCNATISYSRSFHLGGACFSIKYPKNLL